MASRLRLVLLWADGMPMFRNVEEPLPETITQAMYDPDTGARCEFVFARCQVPDNPTIATHYRLVAQKDC